MTLVGAGSPGSVILTSEHLSALNSQLQEVLKAMNEVEISPQKYDTALLAAQIQQLAQEIRELTVTIFNGNSGSSGSYASYRRAAAALGAMGYCYMWWKIGQLTQEMREFTGSNPVTIFNGNSGCSGSYASHIIAATGLAAMGYCYMWWKGLSFSDVMYVTKHNMANAVATVSKQLEHVSEAVVSTKWHLSKRLENLDWKMEEQKETSKLIANDVHELKSNLSQIVFDVGRIHQMVSGLGGKLELLESNQDMTNSGLWYLCQAAAGGIKEGLNAKLFQDVSARKANHSAVTHEENSLKGLQFIADMN